MGRKWSLADFGDASMRLGRHLNCISLLSLAFVIFAPASQANPSSTFDLNSTGIGGSATAPFVQVVLTQIGTGTNGAGEVSVDVTFLSGAQYWANTGNGTNHEVFSFNLNTTSLNTTSGVSNVSGVANTTSTDVSWNIQNNTTTSQSPGGTYTDGFAFDSAAKNGTSGKYKAPLQFDVSATGLVIGDFVANGSGNIFSADVLTAGGTGLVYGGTLQTTTPEPRSYMALLALGMAGIVVVHNLRTRRANQSKVN